MKYDFKGETRLVGAAPLVKHYMTKLGVYEIFDRYIPQKPKALMPPARALCMMILNIVCAPRPLYKLEEWLADFSDGLAEDGVRASLYNDDRLGRSLDALFGADRNSMLTELSAGAIRTHSLETEDVHNDTTSVTLTGDYEDKPPATVEPARGYNKDHRPDCKQIVFGLNMTADGNVPLSFTLFDGNRTDDTTHVANWEELRKLLGKEDFLYVADCKLCSLENLRHIDGAGGKFVTIMPKNRKETKAFHEYLRTRDVDWGEPVLVKEGRKKGAFATYKIYEGDATEEGFRPLWVHGDAKERRDRNRRKNGVENVLEELKKISKKLNKYNLKTEPEIKAAVKKACKSWRDLFDVEIVEEKTIVRTQNGPGRPGPDTKYKEEEKITFRLEYSVNQEAVSRAARSDGIFALITNADMEPAEALKKYKNQPYLEKRMCTVKSVLEVAPVFLNSPRRIEAMLFLYFVALMIVGLVERNIRKTMREEKIEKLPILPTGLKTKTPTWKNLNYFFRNVHLSIVSRNGEILSASVKGVTALHEEVLRLLDVPASVYRNIKEQWWVFGLA